jgi:hypothetical protein
VVFAHRFVKTVDILISPPTIFPLKPTSTPWISVVPLIAPFELVPIGFSPTESW